MWIYIPFMKNSKDIKILIKSYLTAIHFKLRKAYIWIYNSFSSKQKKATFLYSKNEL